MAPDIGADITTLSIHLNELKNKFDQSMREGDSFSNVRIIYIQIKELECSLKAMAWDPYAKNAGNHISLY